MSVLNCEHRVDTRTHVWRGLVLLFLCGITGGVPDPLQAGSSAIAANPTVIAGNGTITGLGTAHVTVNQASPVMITAWGSLGNKVGEVFQVTQPSINAVGLLRVVGPDASVFNGQVRANGSLIFINPNGVFFGPTAQVNVSGLMASSLNIADADVFSGRYLFKGAAANGMVRNEGRIEAGLSGVYLLAPNVTNSGTITLSGGRIMLGAGTTAYLSERSDGRGFLTEITAPSGHALNLGQLVANGGHLSMIGRLVTQSGVVQANSVRQQSGKIELVASERATLTAGSITRATGDDRSASGGGTILVKSDLKSGQTLFQQGAVLDVSGGPNGGEGGFAEVSGASLTLGGRFLAHATAGHQGGRFLIDPSVGTQTVTTADLQGFSGSGASDVEFKSPAGSDLTVNVVYNLAPVFNPATGTLISGWALPANQVGALRFTAGRDLLFLPNTTIQNGPASGASAGQSSTAWNYVLKADNDILFNNTKFYTGGDRIAGNAAGSLTLDAGRDIKLVPDVGGGHSILQTFTGGNIAITTGRDLIGPSSFQGVRPGPTGQYSGIRLEGTGNLTIQTGRDFGGGMVNGVLAGPGFVLSDGRADIAVNGALGSSDNGVNLTIGTVASNPGTQAAALGKTTVNIAAGGNVYVGLVQDRGISDRIQGVPGGQVTANPESAVSIRSERGSIFLNPPDSGVTDFGDIRRRVYPASFSASAPNGDIVIGRLLEFWPSPVGTLDFFAGHSIVGVLNPQDPAGINLCKDTCGFVQNPVLHQPAPVTLTAANGDISGLKLDLVNSYKKLVTISAGGSIRNVFGVISAPDNRDPTGKQVPAVTISAKNDIDFSGRGEGEDRDSGFVFGGTGLVRLTAGGDLDLATSRGLTFRSDPTKVTTEGNQGGLLDIGVGGNVRMTQSRIITNNGADVFVHGPVARDPVVGTAVVASVSTMNGKPVYVVNGNLVLDVSGSPVVVGTEDNIVGQKVLLVGGSTVLGVNGKPITVDHVTSNVITPSDLVHGTAVLDRPLVRLSDGTIIAVINGKTVLGTPPGTAAVDGRPSISDGGATLSVGGKAVNVMEPVGGSVNVGTNQNSVSDNTGLLTVRGGMIDLKSIGSINVNLSRVATLGGGNITLTSTTGDINAGSGARTDVTQFPIEERQPDGTIIKTFFAVPGSGIFTFHPKDGDLPNIPAFNPISPFEMRYLAHQLFGHDVSTLTPQLSAAREAWKEQYENNVQRLFAGFSLGDIKLTAAHDVIVPPAGIRGRTIIIDAGHNLDLQGGQVRGISTVNVGGQVVGSLTAFVGVFVVNLGGVAGGSSTTLSLGNITGNVGNITSSSSASSGASTTSLTGAKSAEDAKSAPSTEDPAHAFTMMRKKKSGGQSAAGVLRVRDTVRIKVETKRE